MVDAVKLAQTAKRLIEKNGRSLTFQKEKEGSVDPSKPWRTKEAGQPNSVTATGAVLSFKNEEFDDLIRFGDKKILVAADSLSNDENLINYDTIVDGSQQLKIITVKEIKPGNTTIVYLVQARV